MTTHRDIKKELRGQALARRDALEPDWRAQASRGMADMLAPALEFAPGTVISGFWPMRSEVDMRPMMAALGDRGARLCLPAILDRTTIVFREYAPSAEMIDMGFGTLGPGPRAEVLDPAIMLVPLAAFDKRGHRIGYGAGYYDRAIARLQARGPAPRLIGVAFSCQEVDRVPDEPHDVVLPEILTEDGVKRFSLLVSGQPAV